MSSKILNFFEIHRECMKAFDKVMIHLLLDLG